MAVFTGASDNCNSRVEGNEGMSHGAIWEERRPGRGGVGTKTLGQVCTWEDKENMGNSGFSSMALRTLRLGVTLPQRPKTSSITAQVTVPI